MSGNTIQVWGGTQWYPIDTSVIVPPGGTDSPYIPNALQRSLPIGMTSAARTNNPRVNAVMTTPPTVTISATHNAALPRLYDWNGGTGGQVFNPPTGAGPFNFSGGLPTTTGFGSVQFPSAHYQSNDYEPVVKRWETNADSIKVEFQVFVTSLTDSLFRIIVDGQYTRLVTTAFTATGFNYITLDFTAAGGRKMRNIIIEAMKDFQPGSNVALAATETLVKPGGSVRRMFVTGDSWCVGNASTILNTFPGYLADLLGVRNVWNGGVPGTGYLAAGGGTLTCRQRISDIVDCSPDILVVTHGYNDASMNMALLQSEVTVTLRTIRSQPALTSMPIILCPFGGNHDPNTQSIPVETAVRAGSAALNDPGIYFIPTTGGPNGPWMTGTGNTGAPAGNGNCDLYISVDAVHPNDAGHAYLAGRMADEITRIVGF
jgi:lysophospholipase L1-like esterase